MASPNGGIKAAEKLHQKLEGSALRNILIAHICSTPHHGRNVPPQLHLEPAQKNLKDAGPL